MAGDQDIQPQGTRARTCVQRVSNAPRQPAQLLKDSVRGFFCMRAPSRHHALDSNADRRTGARMTLSSTLPRTLPRTARATWAWLAHHRGRGLPSGANLRTGT